MYVWVLMQVCPDTEHASVSRCLFISTKTATSVKSYNDVIVDMSPKKTS